MYFLTEMDFFGLLLRDCYRVIGDGVGLFLYCVFRFWKRGAFVVYDFF